jgi:predicted nucleotidyltransferase
MTPVGATCAWSGRTDTPLTDLLAVTYGPLPVITELLAAVEGVDRAYIYGSWAARHQGEPGPVPEDVDVLVVGTADRDALDEIARTAQQRLGRPVNIRRLRARVWAAAEPTDSFVASLRQRPLVELNVHRRQSETATT